MPRLRVVEHSGLIARIGFEGAETPTITLSTGFMEHLDVELSASAEAIRAACVHAPVEPTAIEASVLEPTIDACVRELAFGFVLLHETMHWVGGHLAALRARAGTQSFRLDEVTLAIGTPIKPEPRLQGPLAYMLELEADNSALQWLMQVEPPTSVVALATAFPGGQHPIEGLFDTDAHARLVCFRALTATAWCVLSLLEQMRHGPSTTHPLSEARMISALVSILEQFSEIEPKQDPDGRRTHVLATEEEVDASRGFFVNVLQPVLLAPWPRPGASDVAQRVLGEIHRLMVDGVADTNAGRQLLELDRFRCAVATWLAEHRHYEAR